MRTFLKTVVLAIALVFSVSAGSVMAQATQWQQVSVKKVPTKVMTGQKKLFSRAKVTKAEKTGSGPTVKYRLTMVRKGKTEAVVFNAKGQAQ